jgi:hypothetical protein
VEQSIPNMELVNREDNYTCHHPERITRHKRTMYENEQLPSTWGIVTSSNNRLELFRDVSEVSYATNGKTHSENGFFVFVFPL